MNRRWKMTLMGAAMGAFASGLWTAPAAYFALSAGYMAHGTIYVIASILGIGSMAGIMHLLGIRQEREISMRQTETRSETERCVTTTSSGTPCRVTSCTQCGSPVVFIPNSPAEEDKLQGA